MSWSPPRSLRLPHVLVFAGVDVSVELLLRRLIALLGELHSLLYPLAGLSPYLLELILLDGVGFTALPHLLGQSIGDLDDGLYVHAVYLLVLDAVSVELGSEVSHAGGALDGGAHPVLVVLDDKQAGTLAVPSPEPREVGGFVEGALADRTVTEIELGDVVGLLVAHGVGDADAEGYMPADDAVAAYQAALDVEEVHGAALALYEARLLAVELCHDLFGITTQK